MHDALFRDIPFMGVIRVNELAGAHGFVPGDPEWCNLGQGQPEVGPLPGAPPRIETIRVAAADHAYGPVGGLLELREAVAEHYNRLYRRGAASRYTAENVMIASGGRLALTRCFASIDRRRVGFFTPDYSAYEDLFRTFDRMQGFRIDLDAEAGFRIAGRDLERIIERERLDALLLSNPCNPTGVTIRGEDLGALVDLARRRACTLMLDEFYSHYVYGDDTAGVSAAEWIDDVDRDQVVIFDGLTKCFRYPGWRVGWIVAPKPLIRTMLAAGSFLDGGPSRPIQRAAIDVLEPSRADAETSAVRRAFTTKRGLVLDRLGALGVEFPAPTEGTFYAFGSIAGLRSPLDDGEQFMREGFPHRVLTVPGAYFDLDPTGTAPTRGRLSAWVRFSFGPPIDVVRLGLDRLEQMIRMRGAQTAARPAPSTARR